MNLDPLHIEYFHRARRYLRERDPVGYETVTQREIEHVANALRHEAFLEASAPYRRQKELLLGRFYSVQARPDPPLPVWLQDALAEWDSMIAGVARQFGYSADDLRP